MKNNLVEAAQLKRSVVKNKVPQDLLYGEIAVNANSENPFLTIKDSAGNIIKLNDKPIASGDNVTLTDVLINGREHTSISASNYTIIESLTGTGKADVLYLYKQTDATTSAVTYTQYAYVDNAWVQVSSAEAIDINNYYTKTEVDTALANKADTSAVTEAISSAVSGKVNTSEYNTYTAATDSRLAEDEEVTAAALNDLNEALSGKADSSDVTEAINSAVSGKADTSSVYTKSEVNTALSGKQDTLIAGTNIKTINNESILGDGNITIQGGGGKAVSGGTNISITTGETADTINCTLPITANTSARKYDIAIGNDIIGVGDSRRIIVGSGNKNKYGNARTGNSILIGTPDNATSIYNVVNARNCIGIGGNGLEVGYDDFSGYGSIAIGYGSKSIINKSLAIGHNTVASGTTQTNINNQIKVDTSNQVYIYNKDNTEMICLQDTITATAANTAALGGLSLVKLTQSEYDALAVKDNNTLYILVG